MKHASIIKQIKVARGGGHVRRYHTTPLIGEQNVASHSWGVAVLLEQLWPNCSKILLLAALHHDVSEYHTGDVPAPFKVALSKEAKDPLKEYERNFDNEYNLINEQMLSVSDRAKLQIADKLELMLFCREQILLGNSGLRKVFNKGLDLIHHTISRLESKGHANGQLRKDLEVVYDLIHWLNSEVNN